MKKLNSHPKKTRLLGSQAGQTETKFAFFGSLAVIVADFRPIALRRRLSPGLPLSDVSLRLI
jgi:hypothetical protein